MDKDKLIQELSMIQSNLANITSQKQQFVTQLAEFDSAINTLQDSEKSYRIIGNIMVSSTNEELKEYLEEKKNITNVRIKSFEKQEEKLNEKAEILQKKIMEVMKEDKD